MGTFANFLLSDCLKKLSKPWFQLKDKHINSTTSPNPTQLDECLLQCSIYMGCKNAYYENGYIDGYPQAPTGTMFRLLEKRKRLVCRIQAKTSFISLDNYVSHILKFRLPHWSNFQNKLFQMWVKISTAQLASFMELIFQSDLHITLVSFHS